MKARKRIKSTSSRRTKQLREYRARVKQWLLEHPYCEVQVAVREQLPGVRTKWDYVPSTQVHHSRGRTGKLLLDERYWKAVSDAGHRWIHSNIEAARKLGLICPVGKWNSRD